MKRSYDDMAGRWREEGTQPFRVQHVSKYQQKFPYFRQPKEVGCFSHDANRQFKHSKEQLKFYVPPPNPQRVLFDLTKGYDTFIKKDDTVKEYLDDLLRWTLANPNVFKVQGKETSNGDLCTDFICWRGLLTRLLCTPYENRDGWIISVTKFNNTWYLCEFATEERLEQNSKMDEKGKLMTYGGWKFEQYVVADSPDGQPEPEKPVNNKEAFCSVVRGRLDKHSLVYGGEVDCTDVKDANASQQDISARYVELKTNFEFKHPGQARSYKRFKLIKFWAQSFLLGILRVIVGFKDDQGVVRRLEELQTHHIPQMIKDLHNPWEPTVCFNFLNQFLQYVKETVTIDNPKSCYVFRWKPKENVTVEFYPEKSDFTFLPEWYIEEKTKCVESQ